MTIRYEFSLSDGELKSFTIDLDRGAPAADAVLPKWTELGFHQCPGCPLAKETQPHCPPAADLSVIVADFSRLLSHTTVTVRVVTENREISRTCDVQTGLKALMGLVMATSACPVLSGFSAMAHFHLPFSSFEETVVRAISFHLLKKLYRDRAGSPQTFSLDELVAHFQRMETINLEFTERVNAATEMDANLNAVVHLSADATLISAMLDQVLDDLKPLLA